MMYERQPIANAIVTVEEDGGYKILVIEPKEGYKLRKIGDDTMSSMQIRFALDFEELLQDYHAVTIDTPEEIIEEPVIEPSLDDEISDSKALAIITSGGVDNDES